MDVIAGLHVYHTATQKLECHHKTSFRMASVSTSQDSKQLLHLQVNGDLTLMDLTTSETAQSYVGAIVGNSIIRCAFGGLNERFVLSLSEGEETRNSASDQRLTAAINRWRRHCLGQVHGTLSCTTRGPHLSKQLRCVDSNRCTHVRLGRG